MRWLGVAEMPSDGVYSFTGNPTMNGWTTFYFRGDAPAGQFTLGIVDENGTFIPFDGIISNENVVFRHTPGVVLAVSIAGSIGTTEIGCKP